MFREACSDTGRSWWSSFRSLHDNDIPPRAFTYWIGSYWAVSVMFAGSSFIAPSNSGEVLFSEVAMLVGVCSVGFVLAALVSQVGELQEGDESMPVGPVEFNCSCLSMTSAGHDQSLSKTRYMRESCLNNVPFVQVYQTWDL